MHTVMEHTMSANILPEDQKFVEEIFYLSFHPTLTKTATTDQTEG